VTVVNMDDGIGREDSVAFDLQAIGVVLTNAGSFKFVTARIKKNREITGCL
jgi:hypothetical protein